MAISPLIEQLVRNPQGLSPEAFQLAKQVYGQSRRLEQLGLDTSVAEPRESLFKKALNLIDKPRQIVTGIGDAIVGRGDVNEIGILGAAQRGLDERLSWIDVLRRSGVESPIARGVAGFGLDVLSDPLTYLGGAGAVRRLGGAIPSKLGEEVALAAERGLVKLGISDAAQVGARTDEAFTAMRSYVQNMRKYDKAVKEGATVGLEPYALRMADQKHIFSPYLEAASQELGTVIPDEKKLAELFAKPALRLSANVPFLGHIIPEKQFTEVIKQTANSPIREGFLKKALTGIGATVGKAIAPKRLSVTADIPDPIVRLMQNAADLANEKIADVISTADRIAQNSASAVSGVPLVGNIASGTILAAREGAILAKQTGKALQSIFARKFYEGPERRQLAVEMMNVKAGNAKRARQDAFETLKDFLVKEENGKTIVNKEGQEAAQSALLKIDAQRDPILQAAAQAPETKRVENRIAAQLKTLYEGTDLPEEAMREGIFDAATNQQFRANIDALLANPTTTPAEKTFIQRWLSAHDAMQAREAQHGVNVGLLDAYVMHSYERGAERAAGSAVNVTKQRKFNTLSDALEGGLIPTIDPFALLAKRLQIGENLIAERKYANRFMLMSGMPEPLLRRVVDAAAKEPGGPEWKLLQREGYRVPVGLKAEDMETISRVSKVQSAARARSAEDAVRRIRKGDDIANRLLDGAPIEWREDIPYATHPEVMNKVAQHAQEYSETLTRQALRAGVTPKDFNFPEALFGEVGQTVVDGAGTRMAMPTYLAKVMEENMRGRDIVKATLGQSEVGRKFLKVFDAANSFTRKMFTLPFPGYYANNLFGGAFMAAAEDWTVLNPGLTARMHKLLNGEIAIRSKSGAVLTGDSLKKFARDNGVLFSSGDLLSLMDAAGEMNIEKAIASQRSVVQNLTTKGDRRFAFQQAAQKANDLTDGYLRMSFIMDRFEKGDTLQDALRYSNQALLNYRDLSPIEQSIMRRFYMFYGWTSKASKKALAQYITNPGALQMQLKAARSVAEFFSDPDALPTADQFDSRLLDSLTSAEQVSYAIGSGHDGRKLMARGFALPMNTLLSTLTLNVPRNVGVDEMISWTAETAGRNLQKQFAASNPIINAAAQAVSGKNLYFDKPLDSTFLRRLPSFQAAAERLGLAKYTDIPQDIDDGIKRWLKAVPDNQGRLVADPGRFWVLVNLIPGMSRLVTSVTPLANTNTPVSTALLPALTGVRIEEQDPQRNLLGGMAAQLQNLQTAGSAKLRREAMRRGETF